MKRKYYIFVFIFAILVLVGFSVWQKMSQINKERLEDSLACHMTGSIVSDISGVDCKYELVSYSDSNKLTKSGVMLASGSKWIAGDKIDALSGANINPGFVFKYFFTPEFLTSNILAYDEAGGSKAGFLVFLAREYGLKNIYLLNGQKLNKSLQPVSTLSGESFDFSGNVAMFSGDFPNGYIGSSKFKVVYDPYKINLENDDILLYITDEGNMKLDEFWKANNKKINIKSIYRTFFLEFNGDVKTKEGVSQELSKNSIDLNTYKNIYLYYPQERRKSGLVALMFNQYFAN